MLKALVLTEIAEQDLEQIADYLLQNWGSAVCDKFLIQFEKTCANISLSPRMYRMINKKERIRKCILTKQNTIYYRERRYKIEILTIFDSRKNPYKLKEIIKKDG